MILDALILFTFGFPFVLLGIHFGNIDSDDSPAGIAISIGMMVVTWLYFSIQESGGRQATLGNRVFRLVVTDVNGRRISFWRATGRHWGKYLSNSFFCLGSVIAVATPRKQALHDMVGECVVMKRTAKRRKGLMETKQNRHASRLKRAGFVLPI